MKEINTADALADLIGKGFGDRLHIMENYGASNSTVRRWKNQGIFPIGLHLITLRYILNAMGYIIAELPKDPDIRMLGKLLAFRVIDVDSVNRLLGSIDRDYVLRIFREGCKSPKSLKKIQAINLSHQAKVAECEQRLRCELNGHYVGDTNTAINDALKAVVTAFGALNKFVPTSKPVSRQQFRADIEAKHGVKIHDVARLIDALLSERAFEHSFGQSRGSVQQP